MSNEFNRIIKESVPNQEKMMTLLGRLFDATKPDAVFGHPVQANDHTVITASEIMVGMGAGYGSGGSLVAAETAESGKYDGGGGGGGGGSATARPVAAIIIGPDGVHVEPIVDPTKIALAFFTTLATMMLTFRKMKKN